jgi:YegS/Rv2252/BmrU family lipid kinase
MAHPATISHRTPAPFRHVFTVLNPVAGTCEAGRVRQALERHFPVDGIVCEIHEAGGDDRIAAMVEAAVARGCDLIVAAGGDGTVSAVAAGLVGEENGGSVPLGIIPLGTANVLARELDIPIDLEHACQLLAGPHATTRVDAMRVGPACYFTQIGVGIDALMIRDTLREHKRRFGRVAYLWTAATRLLGFQPCRFTLMIDGWRQGARASQVVVANSGTLGQPPLRWGPDIRPDDGRLDVCIVRARNLFDYLKLSWYVLTSQHRQSPNVRYFTANRTVTIATRRPLPVQGDGEIIGETPVDIVVVPGAVAVIVPDRRAPEVPWANP